MSGVRKHGRLAVGNDGSSCCRVQCARASRKVGRRARSSKLMQVASIIGQGFWMCWAHMLRRHFPFGDTDRAKTDASDRGSEFEFFPAFSWHSMWWEEILVGTGKTFGTSSICSNATSMCQVVAHFPNLQDQSTNKLGGLRGMFRM